MPYRVEDAGARSTGRLTVIRTLPEDYLKHPESKNLGPDGKQCTGRTRGLLQRAHIVAGEIHRIGKELPRGLDEGDEPTEITEFQTINYDKEKANKDDMVQPNIGHVSALRKNGCRKLIREGCSRHFLNKIEHREFMHPESLRDFERAVQAARGDRLTPRHISNPQGNEAKIVKVTANKPDRFGNPYVVYFVMDGGRYSKGYKPSSEALATIVSLLGADERQWIGKSLLIGKAVDHTGIERLTYALL